MRSCTVGSIRLVWALVFAALFATCCDSGHVELETGPRTRTAPDLVTFASCSELENTLKDNLREEMTVSLLSMNNTKYYGVPVPGGAEDDGTNAGRGRQEGADYSGTNVQEAGVDEADFVKTDGYRIYILNGTSLHIADVPAFGLLAEGPRVALEGYPGQMLLDRDNETGLARRAVVFSTVYTHDLSEDHPLQAVLAGASEGPGQYYPSTVLTKLTVIDLSSPENPSVVRELYLEGYYQTARKIGSSVHMVAYSCMYIPGLRYWPELPADSVLPEPGTPAYEEVWARAVHATIVYNNALIDKLTIADFIPALYEIRDGRAIEHGFTDTGCDSFVIAEDGASRGFTSIFSFDLLADDFSFDADHLVSNWSLVYASPDTMLIAEPAQDWWWYYDNEAYDEATNIHRFALDPGGRARYTGSGRVAGTVLNQFSLSEHDEYIRVAATTGQWNQWWLNDPRPPENHVYVLGGEDSLDVVGHIDGIALGERIWSARFIGDRGYLVTFRNIDPLWTIDLSDPENPAILGELEVPGVSTYIHPLDNATLLTIGYGGNEEGLDGSLIVSLFDVADFDSPKQTDSLSLSVAVEGTGWSTWAWSEAVHEHKAFQYWAPKSLLAVPLSTSRYTAGGLDCAYEYVTTLSLVSVDSAAGLSRYGKVDHSSFYASDQSYYWCYQDIRRSIFMGDYIYALSDRAVTAHDLSTLELTGSVLLPGTTCGYRISDAGL